MGVDRFYEAQQEKVEAVIREKMIDELRSLGESGLQIPVGNIKQYLDNCIRHWQRKERSGDELARYYIDAYQSTRMTLFGELLSPKDK